MNGKNLDNLLLKIIFVFEAIIVALIAAGVLPREFSWFATSVILVYIIGANVEDSLILAILSIPFYLALPLSASFDSMANWRIITAILFLKFAADKFNIRGFNIGRMANVKHIKQLLLNENNRLILWSTVFGVIALFSLVGSENIFAGIKKILFLINIFLLFLAVKNLSRSREMFLKILKAGIFAGIFSLIAGYAQMGSVLFYSLAEFWQFWAENVISALYGGRLSGLLSYSNTWFSYYPGEIPPTLRMFSVFPDSHSFALFNIILIPFILTSLLRYRNKNDNRLLIANCLLLIVALLAILLSGSRGAWVSGIAPLGAILLLKIFDGKKKDIAPKISLSQKFKLKVKSSVNYLISDKLGIITSAMLLFLLLFPASSIILEQTQKAEWRRLNAEGDFISSAMYKRFKSIIDLDEISNKGRVEIWKDTLLSIKKHPLLGVGIGNFPTVLGKNISAAKKGASAHNLFLDIASETGILGLLAFLAIICEILKTAVKVFKNSEDDIYKFFALASGVYLFWIMGYALFDVVLFNDKVLMMFMAGIGMLYGIKEKATISNFN